MDQIKKLVCRGYRGYIDRGLLYYVKTEYQEDEYSPGTPMEIYIYTEQLCSDKIFLRDLEMFVKS